MKTRSYNIQILSQKSEALLFQKLQQKCQLKKHFLIDEIESFPPKVKNGLKFYGVMSTVDILQLNCKELYQIRQVGKKGRALILGFLLDLSLDN